MAATSGCAEVCKKGRMINPHPCPTLSLRAVPIAIMSFRNYLWRGVGSAADKMAGPGNVCEPIIEQKSEL